MYVLQSGEVDIYRTWQSEERLLARMKAGDCFGEMALIDLSPRSASARAATDCEALRIAPTVPQAIHACDPEQFTLLHMNMSREISRRMRRVDDMLFRAMMGVALDETLIDPLT
jgi:CRP-like cAMP-binding protein